MSRPRLYQIAVIAAFILLLEALCLAGVIDKITMPPPHIILCDLFRMVLAGRYFDEIGKSLANVLAGVCLSIFDRRDHRHNPTRSQDDP